jgi:serine protease
MDRLRPPSRRRSTRLRAVLGAGLLLVAYGPLSVGSVKPCDYEADPECEDPERGHISGNILIAGANSAQMSRADVDPRVRRALARAAAEVGADPVFQAERALLKRAPYVGERGPGRWGRGPQGQRPRAPLEEKWMPGQVIVRAYDAIRGRQADVGAMLTAALGGRPQVAIGLCNTDTMCLAHVRDEAGKPLDAQQTRAVAERLAAVEGMKWATVNRFSRMTAVPNDDFYAYQWHYGAMNLEAAWDISTGDPDVTVAVVDTGLLTDHPDLAPRYVGGADLIAEPSISNDGDGRDDNPYDPGDNSCGQGCHSYHGSHVAGTVAAATNNASNVAGVSWAGRLLSARVLGQGGQGLNFDIVAAIYWAIGENVDGVATNPTPADVINLSLGGPGNDPSQDEAVQAAIDSGAIVVVAAGNEDVDASGFTPANSPGSIVIAALGNGGYGRPYKAPYSNHGDIITVAAPGGDLSADNDGDGQPDGVLSTMGSDVDFQEGTSMAAPHVSGVAVLMKSLDRSVTQDEVRALLRSNANDNVDCPGGCGAGLVDAARTLLDLDGRANEPLIVANPSTLRLTRGEREGTIVLRNIGGAASDVSVSVSGPGRAQVSVSGGDGNLAPDAERELRVTVDRGDDDVGEASLIFSWGGRSSEALVVWTADEIIVVDLVGVFALLPPEDEGGEFTVERAVPAVRDEDFAYKLFNLTPAEYLIAAISDDNGDGDLDPNVEGVGVFRSLSDPLLVEAEASINTTGVDFAVAPLFNGSEEDDTGAGDSPLGGACARDADCLTGMFCDVSLPGGYCTQDCTNAVCPGDGLCFSFCGDEACETVFNLCLDGCVDSGDCRQGEGYVCDADSTCFPG